MLRSMSGKHTDCACHTAKHPFCALYLKHVQICKAYKTLILIHYFFKKVATSIIANQTSQELGEQEGRREDVEEESHSNTINEKCGRCKENQ